MRLSRPRTALRPCAELLWASDGPEAFAPAPGRRRELVLPTGALHLVIRLDAPPLRVFRDAAATQGDSVSAAVIGGARAGPYLKDISRPAASVGALLRPGAARAADRLPLGSPKL